MAPRRADHESYVPSSSPTETDNEEPSSSPSQSTDEERIRSQLPQLRPRHHALPTRVASNTETEPTPTSTPQRRRVDQVDRDVEYDRPGFTVENLVTPNELPAILPADVPIPNASNTFSHKHQRELLANMDEWNHMVILMTPIMNLEGLITPNAKKSQLLFNENNRGIGANHLLNSLPRERLRAILDNTYVPTAIQKGWHAIGGTAGFSFDDRVEPQPGGDDPGIYMNCVSPRSGIPLSVTEFEHLLGAVRLFAGTLDELQTAQLEELYWEGSLPLGDAVQELWSELHAFEDQSEDEDNCNKFPVLDSLAKSLSHWAHQWTQYLEAAPAKTIYFPLAPEIGYSINLYDRLTAHRQLRGSSNHMMRAVFLVARVLFPNKDFVIYQFPLFRLWNPQHARIAESVGSIINMSYVNVGGFNTAQAGLSAANTDPDNPATKGRWARFGDLFIARGFAAMVEQNHVIEKEAAKGYPAKTAANTQKLADLKKKKAEIDAWYASDRFLIDMAAHEARTQTLSRINEAVKRFDQACAEAVRLIEGSNDRQAEEDEDEDL